MGVFGDLAIKEARQLVSLGIPAIALFPVPGQKCRTLSGEEAFNPDGLIQVAIKKIKSLGVITDSFINLREKSS
jgi:porphobilinogen synthase